MDEQILKARIEKMIEEYNRVCSPVTEHIRSMECMVPTLDGVALKTLIRQPENLDGPFPTIVIRSCYPASAPLLEAQAEALAQRGFAVVYQWCRGLAGSEGQWEPYKYERDDGLSLMNWLQEQDWVKNIGFVGASYLALTGWFIADIIPEKVKTMYLTVLGTEWHTETWQEGAFRQDIFTSWIMGNASTQIKADYLTSAKYRPQINVDEDLWNCHLEVYRNMIANPEASAPYWTEGTWGTFAEIPPKIKIPVFVGEGWYDIHLGNALKTFGKLSEEAREHSVLQVNPGNHGLVPVIPGHPVQEYAKIPEYEQQIRWFRDILMEEKLPDPSIQYYLIGADEWHIYSSYPVDATEEKIFYLDGRHLSEKPNKNGTREYQYDPENPVRSHGAGTLFQTADGIGSLDQPKENWRPDILSYTSEPLKQDMDVVGAIQAKLWVQSDAPDTCFTIKVIEEFENGKAYHIRNGITTLGFRNGAMTRQSYDGKPIQITIKCWDIAWRLKKGSRLRLDISSSNFPEFSIHPNTTRNWAEETDVQIANQIIMSGEEYPSRIILPLDVHNRKKS